MPTSLKEDNRPAQQWYWDDWFSAFDVRLCSLAARGLWIDMLGIMFKAEIRGTLTINGRQINGKALAKIIGVPEGEIKTLLNELEGQDVFSRLPDGTIICRRMFKESGRKDEISRIRSEAGKKGADNRWHDKPIAKPGSKSVAKMAASSSSPTPKDIYSIEFEEFWKSYPRKVAKKKSSKVWKQLSKNKIKEVISAVPNYVKEIEILQTGFKYIKHPTTFLNPANELWADYLPGVWKQPELKIGKEREETPEEYYKRQMEALK